MGQGGDNTDIEVNEIEIHNNRDWNQLEAWVLIKMSQPFWLKQLCSISFHEVSHPFCPGVVIID